MKHLIFVITILSLQTVIYSQTNAQSDTLSTTSQACEGQEFRQFDYWIGEWTVKNTQGDIIGSSIVSRISNGCALLEEWSSVQGNDGKSINFYDSSIEQWRQTWVGGGGLILDLTGGLVKGNMVLSETKERPQGTVTHRITWTPLDKGRIEQKWETSRDGGNTWQQSFVGLYELKGH